MCLPVPSCVFEVKGALKLRALHLILPLFTLWVAVPSSGQDMLRALWGFQARACCVLSYACMPALLVAGHLQVHQIQPAACTDAT